MSLDGYATAHRLRRHALQAQLSGSFLRSPMALMKSDSVMLFRYVIPCCCNGIGGYR